MIIATLVLITSKAKYKNIETMDLVNGIINYTPADIDLVAIQIENDNGEYETTDTIPSSGYNLSDKSYCNVNGNKDESINLTYESGKIGVNNISKKVKCYLYFDIKISASDTIVGNLNPTEKVSFTGIATSSDTGIYKAPDDYGTSYYFRGLEGSLNNWVNFAGSYWRIIRINGNGTVRMIYAGAASGNPSNANRTGTTTQINGATYMYNHTYNDNAYVGYMMGIPLNGTAQTANTTSSNSTSYSAAHTNTYDSNAKATIDSWYKTNIVDKGFSSYVDTNTGFCNDRQTMSGVHSSYGTAGYGTQLTAYAPWGRLYQNSAWKTTQTPTLQCSNKSRDLFTVTSASEGNKKLTYPVGLITSDEVVFGGGFGGTNNSTYYLYTNQHYWTMSPYHYNGSYALVFGVRSDGYLGWNSVVSTFGLRPVINLKSDTKMTGSGSSSDPFVVQN